MQQSKGAAAMLDHTTVKMMHPHDGQAIPMEEVSPRDAAQYDPEQAWRQGARIFRCQACDAEIMVMPPGDDLTATEPR
jgi:hypothetical protein